MIAKWECSVKNLEQHPVDVFSALLHWDDLWPYSASSSSNGWSEQVNPGVTLLLDETGDEAVQWLAVITGFAKPVRGRVACAGLDSQTDIQAYQAQVFWHNPRAPLQDKEISAAQWIHAMAQRWPAWGEVQWQAHCGGFGLTPHMDKPLWHLSTGCLRKLGIAAALASGARLTVIEEPIAALDGDSIRYLCQALDTLGESVAEHYDNPRWVLVAHWEPLPSVTWDEVLVAPSLASA